MTRRFELPGRRTSRQKRKLNRNSRPNYIISTSRIIIQQLGTYYFPPSHTTSRGKLRKGGPERDRLCRLRGGLGPEVGNARRGVGRTTI